MESRRLARQHHFFLALFFPMVRDRKKETGRSAARFLVAQSDRLAAVADLRALSTRFRFHFCLRLYLDPLHSQFDHSSSASQSHAPLCELRNNLSTSGKILRELRHPIRELIISSVAVKRANSSGDWRPAGANYISRESA